MGGVYPHTKFEVDRAHRKRDMEDLILRERKIVDSAEIEKWKL